MPRFVLSETDRLIGRRIKRRRKQLNVTQADLAVVLQMSFQQVQKYERGKNQIAASLLAEIAHQLGVPIGYFFEEDPPGKA